MYENICKSRFFELELARAFNEKQIIGGIFLSLGQECVAAALAEIIHSYYIFPQHRAHDLFISLGLNLEQFRNELRGLPSGFNNGRTGPIYLRYMKDEVKIIGYTHFIGENVPRAVGAALVTGEKTVCIFGDGAAALCKKIFAKLGSSQFQKYRAYTFLWNVYRELSGT